MDEGKKKGLGIALSGGGLKGVAHIGVLKALEEDGIKCDFIAGSSAGSIVAALYACGMRPRQMADVVLGLRRKDYLDFLCSFQSLRPKRLGYAGRALKR